MLANEPAQAAANRQARDTRGRNERAGGCELEHLEVMIEFAPGESRLDAHRPRRRLDAHALHLGQIDENPVVTDGRAGNVVADANVV